MCIAAYTGVLSALGLGFLFNERVLAPLIAAFLLVGVGSIAWSARSHGRRAPLVVAVAGAGAVVAGRLLWTLPSVLYVGIALLVVGSLWNLWLKRPQRSALARLGGRSKMAAE
jgi:hypothetical protein